MYVYCIPKRDQLCFISELKQSKATNLFSIRQILPVKRHNKAVFPIAAFNFVGRAVKNSRRNSKQIQTWISEWLHENQTQFDTICQTFHAWKMKWNPNHRFQVYLMWISLNQNQSYIFSLESFIVNSPLGQP